MSDNTLDNKSFLSMITHTDGEALESANLSTQNGILKSDDKYDVNCAAANDVKASRDTRSGQYQIQTHSDNQSVIHHVEETGPFPGEYNATINWLDKNTGNWLGEKDGKPNAVIGVVKTLN